MASSNDGFAAVVKQQSVAIASCLFYSFCSISMVLGNKLLMSNFGACKQAPFGVLAFQSAVVTLLLLSARALKFVEFPAFDATTALKWLPVNLGFVLMLQTGLMSIGLVAVPMVTVFKNLTNIFTVTGDRIFFGQKVGGGVILSLALMSSGALLAAAHDLSFDPVGYIYMLANCLCTSGYVLLMRWRTTDKSLKLGKIGMVYYNNLLAIFTSLPFAFAMGEGAVVAEHWRDTFSTSYFLVVCVLSSMVGAALNFSAYWCVSSTSATTYATIGALNKIPLIGLGAALFGDVLTGKQLLFVSTSMAGGFVYSYVKFKEAEHARVLKESRSKVSLTETQNEDEDDDHAKLLKSSGGRSPARVRLGSFGLGKKDTVTSLK